MFVFVHEVFFYCRETVDTGGTDAIIKEERKQRNELR